MYNFYALPTREHANNNEKKHDEGLKTDVMVYPSISVVHLIGLRKAMKVGQNNQ